MVAGGSRNHEGTVGNALFVVETCPTFLEGCQHLLVHDPGLGDGQGIAGKDIEVCQVSRLDAALSVFLAIMASCVQGEGFRTPGRSRGTRAGLCRTGWGEG